MSLDAFTALIAHVRAGRQITRLPRAGITR